MSTLAETILPSGIFWLNGIGTLPNTLNDFLNLTEDYESQAIKLPKSLKNAIGGSILVSIGLYAMAWGVDIFYSPLMDLVYKDTTVIRHPFFIVFGEQCAWLIYHLNSDCGLALLVVNEIGLLGSALFCSQDKASPFWHYFCFGYVLLSTLDLVLFGVLFFMLAINFVLWTVLGIFMVLIIVVGAWLLAREFGNNA